MEKWIIKKLMEKGEEIAKLYQEMVVSGKIAENMCHLQTLLEEEKRFYRLIPISKYDEYISFLSSNPEDDFNDYLAFMVFEYSFLPPARMVHKLYYYREKSAMFSENVNFEDKEQYQYQYLFDYEFFSNLFLFYTQYLKEKKDFAFYLNTSLLNMVYHFAYAEEIFIRNSSYGFDNKKRLQKFSMLSTIEEDLDAEFSCIIQEYMDVIIEEDALPFEYDEYMFRLPFYIYFSTLYFSIDNDNYVHDLLGYYKASNHPKLSFSTRNFLDEIQILIQNSEVLRKKLKIDEI